MGDREKHLRKALAGLGRLRGTLVLSRSRIYETAPVGPSRRPYLNMAARLRTALSPMGLLVELKRLEAGAGRRPGLRWGARPLDIDILDYGGLRLRTAWLTLPHPRVVERAFALAPLADVAPGWSPDGRRSVVELLGRLKPDPGTVKLFKHA